MRLRLVGDNASYLAHRWLEHGLVDKSDDEESVEVYPKPNSPGADALYDCYLKRLVAEASDVSVGLMLDDRTRLPCERNSRGWSASMRRVLILAETSCEASPAEKRHPNKRV